MKQNRRRKFVLGLDLNIVVTRIRIIKDRIIQENTMLTVWLAWWLYSGVEDADTQTRSVSDVKERRITNPDNVSRITQIVKDWYTQPAVLE